MGRYTAFQTTRRWSIRRKELAHKVKELKYMKSGGHEAKDQEQIWSSSTWINNTGSVYMKQVLQS